MPSNKQSGVNLTIVVIGTDKYWIPTAHLGPGLSGLREAHPTSEIEVGFNLPDYSGYRDDQALLGAHEAELVRVSWGHSGTGIEKDANTQRARLVNFGLVDRVPTADSFELVAYAHNSAPHISYYWGQMDSGETVLIRCGKGEVNSICTATSFNKQNRLGITYVFDMSHLRDWESIFSEINQRVCGWKSELISTNGLKSNTATK